MRAAVAGLFLLFGAAEAAAGAWPREDGATFVAIGQTFSTGLRTLLAPNQTIDGYSSLYAEYGLTSKLTLGLDAAQGSGPDASLRTALVFARYPLGQSPWGDLFAADLGLGWREDSRDGNSARLRAGLAWGRGFETGWGPGWMGIEGSAELLTATNDQIFKADATLGLKPTPKWMLILQAQTGRYNATEPILRIAPSVVRAIGSRGHLQFGLERTVAGGDTIGVRLGAWFSF